MNREEIESRILICEIRERDYLEVGNTKTADRYRNEIYKWREILEQSNPNMAKELADYRKGYNNLKQILSDIREDISKDIQECTYGQVPKYQDILQIIDKVLGDDESEKE